MNVNGLERWALRQILGTAREEHFEAWLSSPQAGELIAFLRGAGAAAIPVLVGAFQHARAVEATPAPAK